jgi:hypothetical protein
MNPESVLNENNKINIENPVSVGGNPFSVSGNPLNVGGDPLSIDENQGIVGGKNYIGGKNSKRRMMKGGFSMADLNPMNYIPSFNKNKSLPENSNIKLVGGKRKLSEWNKFVLRIFRENRKTNKKYSYGQALKEASILKKAGKMTMKKESNVPAKKSAKKSAKKTMKCKKEYV